MDPVVLAIPMGILIGLIVGAVGGGGGVLGLPVLVYLLGQPVGPASTASLVVVAVAAGIGAGVPALRGHVCWRVALTFTAPAAVGSFVGTLGNHAVSAKALILAFVPVMLVASAATWQRARSTTSDEMGDCPAIRRGRILLAGLGVGGLTGFFGVGGGFMIVPVLILGLGFSFRRAVATSLVILTLTGLAALASHIAVGAVINVSITISLSVCTAIGALLGSILGQRVPQAALGRGFAVIMAGVALFLFVDTLMLGGPPHG